MTEVRPMTYNEREAFIDSGLDPMFSGDDLTPQREREIVKWILKNVYKDVAFDHIAYPKCRKLAYSTYELTIQTEEDEVKNC